MLDLMECLKNGVPLSLVIDMLSLEGPDASRIYAEELADTSWIVPRLGEVVHAD